MQTKRVNALEQMTEGETRATPAVPRVNFSPGFEQKAANVNVSILSAPHQRAVLAETTGNESCNSTPLKKINERATMDHALCGLRVNSGPGLEQKAANVKMIITSGVDQGGVVADTTKACHVFESNEKGVAEYKPSVFGVDGGFRLDQKAANIKMSLGSGANKGGALAGPGKKRHTFEQLKEGR